MPWVCSICSTNNPDNAKVCFVCDAERVKIKPIKEPESKREATVRKAKPKKEKRSETRIRDTELTPPPAIPAVTELRKPSKRRGAKRETDSTSTRGAGMRSTPRTASSARARTDRERSTEREANFKESLINARTVIVFSTVFAAVICGLAEQLKTWQVFEWIVGVGCGCSLLFWAICICTNSIGYFKVQPKKWWSVTALALGMLLNVILFFTAERFLVVFIWWSVYAVAGGVLTIRWAYKNDYKGIFWTAIAETAAAVLLCFLPLIA